MNLFLHGIEDFKIVRGDTLAHPAFVAGDRLKQFDVVLANPPYSIKQWDLDAWSADPWGRNVLILQQNSGVGVNFFIIPTFQLVIRG